MSKADLKSKAKKYLNDNGIIDKNIIHFKSPIDNQINELSDALTDFAAQENKAKWISVEDELPEFKTNVLVYLGRKNVYRGFLESVTQYKKDEKPSKHWKYYTDFSGDTKAILASADFVTYWMPLPNIKHLNQKG